jgi:hypothetical protein
LPRSAGIAIHILGPRACAERIGNGNGEMLDGRGESRLAAAKVLPRIFQFLHLSPASFPSSPRAPFLMLKVLCHVKQTTYRKHSSGLPIPVMTPTFLKERQPEQWYKVMELLGHSGVRIRVNSRW